jgi:rSAM/selenodomain-associated transferase 2
MAPLISIVIPVLADTAAARSLLATLPVGTMAAGPPVEIILVDGGHDDNLDRLAETRPDVRLYRTAPGRGHQMNVGARAASGEWLLFLHADSRLPPGWVEALQRLDSRVTGGWFGFALDDEAWQARLIEYLVSWRVRVLSLPYGDQALFVRRRVFESMSGYRELPLFEDVEFVRRLLRTGEVAGLSLSVRTSARRWKRDGWFRRSARNVALVVLYFAGVPPAWLARRYSGGERG